MMTKNNIYILFGSGDNVPTKISRSSGACQLMKDKRASQSMYVTAIISTLTITN